jgi:hypothetical protein
MWLILLAGIGSAFQFVFYAALLAILFAACKEKG